MLLGDGMPRLIRGICGSARSRAGRRRARPARRLGVGESTAIARVGRWRRTGSSEAKSQKGRSRSPLAMHEAFLVALVDEQTDLTLEEIRERLAARGVRVAVSSIWRFFDRHGISLKKRCTLRSSSVRTWQAPASSLIPG